MGNLTSCRIIFDLDGTLVDSVGSLAKAGAALCTEMGRPIISPADYAKFVGRGIKAQVVDLLYATGGLPPDGGQTALKRFNDIYAQDPVSGVSEYTGARHALRLLADKGHKIGVCTQKPVTPARMILSELGMMPLISALTGGDSLPGILKPDPLMLRRTAALLGSGPVIYVGDSGIDAKTAENAGVRFILTAWGYRNARAGELRYEELLTDYADLPDMIERMLLI